MIFSLFTNIRKYLKKNGLTSKKNLDIYNNIINMCKFLYFKNLNKILFQIVLKKKVQYQNKYQKILFILELKKLIFLKMIYKIK